jgi:hypothetical protein
MRCKHAQGAMSVNINLHLICGFFDLKKINTVLLSISNIYTETYKLRAQCAYPEKKNKNERKIKTAIYLILDM